MEEKMTFKLTEEQAKLIRNALAIAADTYKDKEKQDKAEELHELFRRRLADRNFNKGEGRIDMNGAVKINYLNAYGKEEIGYTTETELEDARQGVKAFIWATDDKTEIEDGKIKYGYTVDYLDITKIFE